MKKGIQLVALLLTVVMSSCTGGKDKAAVKQEDEKPRVKVADVTARPVDQIQDYTATVEAEVKNNIAPSSPVRIDRILVEVGDRVSKGQKLVQMDAANLTQTKLQLDNQQIEFNRIDELYKVGGASKSEWDAAKMQLDVKQTAYDNLVENTFLLSPINGVITARNYDNGRESLGLLSQKWLDLFLRFLFACLREGWRYNYVYLQQFQRNVPLSLLLNDRE